MPPDTLFDRLFDRRFALIFASLLILGDLILRVFGVGSVWQLKAAMVDTVITLGQLLCLVSAYFLFYAYVVSEVRFRITHMFWTPLYYLFRHHKDTGVPSNLHEAMKLEWDVEAVATEHDNSVLWERLEEHRKINRKVEEWSDILFAFAVILLGAVWTRDGIFAIGLCFNKYRAFLDWLLTIYASWLILLSLKPIKRKWDFLVYLPNVSVPKIKT